MYTKATILWYCSRLGALQSARPDLQANPKYQRLTDTPVMFWVQISKVKQADSKGEVHCKITFDSNRLQNARPSSLRSGRG